MITRRTFVAGSCAAAAVSAVPGAAATVADSFHQMKDGPTTGISIDTMVNDGPDFEVEQAIAAGLTGAVVDLAIYPRNYPNAVAALSDWTVEFRRNPLLVKVLKSADLVAAKTQKKFGVILTCQDAQVLDASTVSVNDYNIRNLEFFHELGVRILQLTHNERNGVGDSFREKNDAGLSRLGEKIVPAMNSLGMLIDLSHCSRKTGLETIQLSKQPCAFTHAGCYALCPTARNKSDEEIRALADKGGVMGIFNMSMWLTRNPQRSISDIIDHIDHVVKIAGVEHVCFGSDGPVLKNDAPEEAALKGSQSYYERNKGLPGAEWRPEHTWIKELNVPDRLKRLAEGLSKRGYSANDVDKITGGNFVRLFHDVCG